MTTKIDEKIATLNQMIKSYNDKYKQALPEIKEEDDIHDMKYDLNWIESELREQVDQLADIIEYIESEDNE